MSDIGTDMDIASMKVADLKKELKARGLTTSGNKTELIERLQMATMGNESDILADADGDVLLDDDDDNTKGSAEEEEAPKVVAAVAAVPTKKVSINRDVELPKPDEEAEKEEKENVETPVQKHAAITAPESTPTTEDDSEAKKTASKMTDDERAKARAERFGVTAEETKKQARAERFGGGASSIRASVPEADVEKLKKRAERFGQTSSTTLKKLEVDEQRRKRAERFGDAATEEVPAKKVALNTGVNSVVLDEKMKKRAERFGL